MLLRVVLARIGVVAELKDHAFFYLYGLVGPSVVFAIAAYLAGRRAEKLKEGRDRYLALAEHDDLTRLLNSRAFRKHYDRAIEHARRFAEPLSLLLADVDSLKEINDRAGHSAGNEALLQVAGALEKSKRAQDLACPWGGDEFAVLMPGADSTAAVRVAQTILDRLRSDQGSRARRNPTVSVTIGVAAAIGSTGEDLFDLADEALYERKRRGRGQFQLARAGDSAGAGSPS